MSDDFRTVLVTGSNRGIGLELVRSFAADGWRVVATCRDPANATELAAVAAAHPAVAVSDLDVCDAGDIDRLAADLRGQPVDLLLHNAGVYGRKALPLGAVDPAEWISVFETNTIAPFLLTRALLPQLEQGRDKRVAMLSSKVGSIEDNSSGGNYAYRTSKAALNQVVKSLSIDLAGRSITVVALHPGWVKTEMGGPNALIDTAESVAGLRRVLGGLTPSDTGRFLAFDGKPVPW